MPRVSVVIPVYNCAPYVAEAVESVLGQSFGDLELIVVDDGSTDGSILALAPYRHRFKLVSQQNRGVAAARNSGLRVAAGDFVAFLDADDWWTGSRLSAQLAALDRFSDAGLAFSNFSVKLDRDECLGDGGIRWKYRLLRDAGATPLDRIFKTMARVNWVDAAGIPRGAEAYFGRIDEWLFRGNFINTSSVLVRRDAIWRMGGFDERLDTEEDYDCWMRLSAEFPFTFVDAPLVGFRRRSGQLTRASQIERVHRNVLRVVQAAAIRGTDKLDRREVAERLSALQLDLAVTCLRSGRSGEARRLLRSSLDSEPRQALAQALLGLTYLPGSFFRAIEAGYRRVRSAIGRSPSG